MKLIKPIVLASRSPRRIALLKQIGIDVRVVPGDTVEEFDENLSPEENVVTLAVLKAKEIGEMIDDAIIIGADTTVVLDRMYLAKPSDQSDARRMLRLLSNRTHIVYTGYALLDRPSNQSVSAFEATSVTFREIPDYEIAEYVATGSPMDKAGAYGIQDDYGAVFVKRIEGCYYNVVGFPLSSFYTTLKQFQSHLMKQ